MATFDFSTGGISDPHSDDDHPHTRSDIYELGDPLQAVLVDEWRRLGDAVAERAVMLGLAIDGQVATIAGASRIRALPAGRVSDGDAIDGLTDRLAEVIERTRGAMGEAAVRDTVTEDLLVDVVMTLEKQYWMLRAQRRGRPS